MKYYTVAEDDENLSAALTAELVDQRQEVKGLRTLLWMIFGAIVVCVFTGWYTGSTVSSILQQQLTMTQMCQQQSSSTNLLQSTNGAMQSQQTPLSCPPIPSSHVPAPAPAGPGVASESQHQGDIDERLLVITSGNFPVDANAENKIFSCISLATSLHQKVNRHMVIGDHYLVKMVGTLGFLKSLVWPSNILNAYIYIVYFFLSTPTCVLR
jgi:hypothetical protein